VAFANALRQAKATAQLMAPLPVQPSWAAVPDTAQPLPFGLCNRGGVTCSAPSASVLKLLALEPFTEDEIRRDQENNEEEETVD
jgi:hypothetical protein